MHQVKVNRGNGSHTGGLSSGPPQGELSKRHPGDLQKKQKYKSDQGQGQQRLNRKRSTGPPKTTRLHGAPSCKNKSENGLEQSI
jgi:hypothetical protein